MTLSEEKIPEVSDLLLQHVAVDDALISINKASYSASILINHKDGSADNSTIVPLGRAFAKKVLEEQRSWIESQLKKLGIELK